MVAAHAASHAPDVRAASELGSLVHAHRLIGEPRWRLEASVRLGPALLRFKLSLDRLRADMRSGVRAALCPFPYNRNQLTALLFARLEDGDTEALSALVTGLFETSRRGSRLAHARAMLAFGDFHAARAIAGMEEVARRGYLPAHGQGRTVPPVWAALDVRHSETELVPSLPLFSALVTTICARRQRERMTDAWQLFERLPAADRPYARAHAARMTLELDSAAVASQVLRGIREGSIRAGGLVLLVRAALARGELDIARTFADRIDKPLLRQLAQLDIARVLGERGQHLAALRMLQRVDDPRLLAEQRLVHAEIRLSARHRDEPSTYIPAAILARAYGAPAWLGAAPRPEPRVWRELVGTTATLRAALRSADARCVLDDVARTIRKYPAHRRALLELWERAGISSDDALLALQGTRGLDALRADAIALRAERIVTGHLPEAMMRGLRGEAPSVADPYSVQRALHDEGLALASAVPQRRRALIAAAQHCLRTALGGSGVCAREAVAARLRTLVHLGGELGRNAITKAITTLPPHKELTLEALAALCALDPAGAASFVLARPAELRAAGVDVHRAMQVIEASGGVARGFARAYADAQAALEARNGAGTADRWLTELAELYKQRAGAFDRMVLSVLARQSSLPATPHELVAALDRIHDTLLADDHIAVAAHAHADAIFRERLVLARPARVDPTMRAWELTEWQRLFTIVRKHSGVVDRNCVSRCARLLGRGDRCHALLRGELAALGAQPSVPLDVDGHGYRVRLLDKRLDVLTYLRFADVPVDSCFRSDSWAYVATGFNTREATISAWKDPLTLCFHIERGDERKPCGFVFGSFAELAGEPALVLNGLHVRPNRGEVRIAILRALEENVCAPLRIRALGIACVHGGFGPLPSGYEVRSVRLTRLRALTVKGEPVSSTYDDIGVTLNREDEVPDLYWKDLR